MLDKIKNSKITKYIVGLFLGILAILKIFGKVTVKQANKDLEKAIKEDHKLEIEHEKLLTEANTNTNEVNEIENKISKIKDTEDWHKTFKRKK